MLDPILQADLAAYPDDTPAARAARLGRTPREVRAALGLATPSPTAGRRKGTTGPQRATRARPDPATLDEQRRAVVEALEQLGTTHRGLAELLGVSSSLVSRWVGGQRRPTAHHLARLAELRRR